MAEKITFIKALDKELCGYWPGSKRVAEQYVMLGVEPPPDMRLGVAPLKAHQLTLPARMEGVQKGFLSASYGIVAPVCAACPTPCVTLRINTEKFSLSKTQKEKMNDGRYNYSFSPTALLNPRELYRVFRDYTRDRHNEKESGMGKWDMKRFQEWLGYMPFMIMARARDGRLAGFTALNAGKDFAVLEYLVYDPAFSRDSIGKRLWLQMAMDGQKSEIAHIYVGAWSKGSPKLDYKKNHSGLETIVNGEWVDFDPAIHAKGTDYRSMLKSEGFDIK